MTEKGISFRGKHTLCLVVTTRHLRGPVYPLAHGRKEEEKEKENFQLICVLHTRASSARSTH